MREETQHIIRLGVIGTGRIAGRFIQAAGAVDSVDIACVYNPHAKSAETFAAKHGLSSYTDQWDVFLEHIDAAYIASPHETHAAYIEALLMAGKHVLCEKPMCLKREEVVQLYDMAAKHSCILQEAVKTAYCPGFLAMMEMARSGKIGELRDVEACFSRLTKPDVREMTDTVYGGSVTEFGSYVLLPIWKLLGTDYTDKFSQSVYAESGVDLYTKLIFTYKEGMAAAKVGLGVKSEGQLVIAGTKGYILCESPWWMTKRFEVRYEDPNCIEVYEYPYEGSGLQYELAVFVSRIHGEAIDPHVGVTPEESIASAAVMEWFLNENRERRR